MSQRIDSELVRYRDLAIAPVDDGISVDPVLDLVRRIYAVKERLVRRMLTFWDPAWGKPELIEGPDRFVPLNLYAPDRPARITISILGLAIYSEGESFSPRNLRVMAKDHMDEAGNVLPPPDGPFPLPALPNA